MTLNKLILTIRGYDSIGLYDSDDNPIQVEASLADIVENENKEVRHADLFVYDTEIIDINNNVIPIKRIRMCVYLIA